MGDLVSSTDSLQVDRGGDCEVLWSRCREGVVAPFWELFQRDMESLPPQFEAGLGAVGTGDPEDSTKLSSPKLQPRRLTVCVGEELVSVGSEGCARGGTSMVLAGAGRLTLGPQGVVGAISTGDPED